MKILPASTGIDLVLRTLQSGGVIAHATETCYGLTCDLTNPDAVRKLFDIKKRSYDQPVSALFSSVDEAKRYAVFSPKALELAKKYLPGPLTLVLPVRADAPALYVAVPSPLTPLVRPPRADGLPSPLPSGEGVGPACRQAGVRGTIGIRISSHPLASELVRRFGKPIATTSANLHGLPNPYSVLDIEQQFTGQSLTPELVLDSGKIPLAPASTVVEVVGDTVRVLRQGDLTL